MNVDFKVTAWERVDVPDEMADEVKEALKSGQIQTANDLINFVDEKGKDYEYKGVIAETEEQLTVGENDGQSTIEVIEDEKTTWENGNNPLK